MAHNVILTRSLGDDASQKDLLFAMLMSTGDGSSSIKADWQKVEKIMISWGYTFTIGAMCKSSRVDAHACAFLSYLSTLCRVRRGWVFHASPTRTIA